MSRILAPDDPAVYVLKNALDARPDFDTTMEIVPWVHYREKLMETLQATAAPHAAVFVPGHIWIPELVHSGYLADLKSLISSLPENRTDAYDMDDIIPTVLSEGIVGDGLYQLPFFTDGHLLFYRKDIIDPDAQSGVPVIATRILASMAQKAHNPPHVTGLALKADSSEIFTDFLPYLWEENGRILDPNGLPDLASKHNIAALERYTGLRRYCSDRVARYGNAEIAKVLRTGSAALVATWGGQAAPIMLDADNPWRDRYGVAIFPKPWNATWGIAIPHNQPFAMQQHSVLRLLDLLGPRQDRAIIRAAGSPVRRSSYDAEALRRYPWLAAQREMLARASILPKDPKLGRYLGALYTAVHRAFTRLDTPAEALKSVQAVAMQYYV